MNNNKLYRAMEEVALEDIDLVWSKEEIKKVVACWKEGRSKIEMARYLKRTVLEITILLLDLADKKKIEKRLELLWDK